MAKRKKRLLKPAGEAKQKRKITPPTEIERKMGQIVVDFANAETTDAACFKHFENMQKFMAFSSDFAERAREAYPAFYRLHSSLTDPEREFLRLTIEKQNFHGWLNRALEDLGFFIVSYDPKTSLHIVKIEFGWDDRVGGSSVRMTVDEFKDEIRNDSEVGLPPTTLDLIDEFVEAEKQILTIKSFLSESRINELKEIMSDYEELYYLHCDIEDLQGDLQNILGGIVKNTPLHNLPRFEKYLDKYNELPLSRFMVTKDLLIENPPIIEESYFQISSPDGWFTRFKTDLTYCLIGFLKGEGNRKYIAKCLWCEKYFIRTKYNPTNPQKFCRYNGDDCKDDWHYRERVKSGKAAKYIKNGRAEGKYQ
jgi:hypothetical protein